MTEPQDKRQAAPGTNENVPALCRDCATLHHDLAAPRCPNCGSPRLYRHRELASLAIAHIDCDAFYASIEKRDDPSLTDKPVIVGGRHRGVVAACCYVARLYGVRSAMPMFKALEACPDAVVIPPEMAKYQAVGRQIRQMMLEITPLVEPLSVDEAYLDLTGTESLHGAPPAVSLARLVRRIEQEVGVTASVGLSYNKFLAKIASDLDKPRGFAVLGRDDAMDFLGDKPVGIIWGVGAALQKRLASDGITAVRHLRRYDEAELMARYGAMGRRLHAFARGEDHRAVDPNAPTKSISGETTFEQDIAQAPDMLSRVWPLCETVSFRLKKANLAGQTVTLKLKTSDFRTLTRSRRMPVPTQLADVLYREVRPLIEAESDGRKFRLIGVGASDLVDGALADPPTLLDPERRRRSRTESVMDEVRERLGSDAIRRGRGLR